MVGFVAVHFDIGVFAGGLAGVLAARLAKRCDRRSRGLHHAANTSIDVAFARIASVAGDAARRGRKAETAYSRQVI
jgi:hypothetical protein